MKFLNKIDGASKLVTDSSNRLVTDAEKTKLAGIATGATKNDTDANLKSRANHTGTQLSSTISDFATAVRATALTGLSLTTNAVISATDTILSALGKLQKQISDNLSTLTNHINNKSNPHSVTKTQIDLGNVDNTSDLNKPISTVTQTALNGKVDNSRVLTDVPLNAKFTDTITTINGKTGAIAKSDITALGVPAQDTTYGVATTSTSGLMSSTDKTNLDNNTAARHTHSNKSVIDKFTEVDNKPYYNGEEIGGGTSAIIKSEEIISTEGQTVFTLTKGTYTPNENKIAIYIWGVKQHSNAFIETSTTSFTLSSGLKSGDRVIAEWFETSPSIKGDKGDKGDTGDKGDNGVDGTVSFDELTISQKSELTEGLRDDIAEELQADTVSIVNIPSSNVFANVPASMLSYETFTPDTLKVVSIIEKNALVSGNYYSSNRPLVGLYKNDKNYIRLYVSGYDVKLENKVSGVSTNITYNNVVNSINPLSDVHITLDLIRKKIELKGLNNTGALVTIIDEDISSFDLSALDSFKIMSGAGKHTGNQFNIYVRINEYFDYETLLLEHMRVNDYNSLPIIDRGTGIYPATSINLGGTITNTISNTHKIADVNMKSYRYFAMQGNNTSISSLTNTTIVTRFKVTSMTEGTYFGNGAASTAIVVDEDNNIVYKSTGTFVPELNKWYYLSNTTNNATGYFAMYGMRAFGTFTIEVEGLYIGYPKSQNMCAETWNGSYFTGSLPFKGTNVEFTTMSPTSQTGKYIPIGSMTLDASKNIMMYNGVNWLKLN